MKIKKEKSDNIWDNITHYMWYFLIGFVFIICVLIFLSKKGYCASNDVNSYPFNIAIKYIDNSTGNSINGLYFDYLLKNKDILIEHINNDLTSQNVPYDSYLVFISDISNRTTNLHGAQPHIQITYTILTNPTINTNIVQSDSFISTVCPITYTNSVNYRQVYIPSTDQNSYTYRATYNGGTFNSLGTVTFINYTPFIDNTYLGSGVYNANYPIIAYNIGNGITATNDTLCIIDLATNLPVNTGHATPPDTFHSPIYTQGHSKPENVPPSITVNNYTWTTYTPPTVDNSTLEKLLESLTDIVKYNATYLKDNLHNEFTNLINNIKSFVDYIGETIQYYGDLIIENIQNLITTFYNNMLSLFEPISTAIDYISQPLDIDSLTDTVNSTQIFDDVDTCTTFANDAFGIYGTVVEPNTFKIPLDLRSISLLNITEVYYIDLSWLDSAKTAIRAFMWCVVTFGLLYSVIVDIPNMIRSSK